MMELYGCIGFKLWIWGGISHQFMSMTGILEPGANFGLNKSERADIRLVDRIVQELDRQNGCIRN